MRLLWFTNIPSPYRVAFFSQLGRQCDLTVVFERGASGERDSSWQQYRCDNFTGVVLKGIPVGVDKAWGFGIAPFLREEYDHVIVSNFLTPTGMRVIAALRRRHIPYYLESDGGFYHPSSPLITALKTRVIRGATGYFSTGAAHDTYYLAWGASPDRLIRYPFSSVTADEILSAPPTAAEKAALREALGISRETPMVVTVGQFIPRKGFDLLLKALGRMDTAVCACLIGGHPPDEYTALAKELPLCDIRFLDFMSRRHMGDYFRAADLFVLPTRYDIWGLVVNEAMAYGLPVITTDRCLAGLELIEDGVNGYLVPAQQIDPLAEQIAHLCQKPALRLSMAQNNLKKIRHYTVETMVTRHIDYLKNAERLR